MTTPANEALLAAANDLEAAAAKLRAIAAGEMIPNAFFGVWDNEPEMIAPEMDSIIRNIADAKTLLGL